MGCLYAQGRNRSGNRISETNLNNMHAKYLASQGLDAEQQAIRSALFERGWTLKPQNGVKNG
jgi:hypothetical protein